MVPGTFSFGGQQYFTCDANQFAASGAGSSVGNCELNVGCGSQNPQLYQCKAIAFNVELIAAYENICGPALAGQAYGVYVEAVASGTCSAAGDGACPASNLVCTTVGGGVCAHIYNCVTQTINT